MSKAKPAEKAEIPERPAKIETEILEKLDNGRYRKVGMRPLRDVERDLVKSLDLHEISYEYTSVAHYHPARMSVPDGEPWPEGDEISVCLELGGNEGYSVYVRVGHPRIHGVFDTPIRIKCLGSLEEALKCVVHVFRVLCS